MKKAIFFFEGVMCIIKLPVSKVSINISFRVFPVKDEMIRGNQEIRFQIDAVNGTLSKGSNDIFELFFLDNEPLR